MLMLVHREQHFDGIGCTPLMELRNKIATFKREVKSMKRQFELKTYSNSDIHIALSLLDTGTLISRTIRTVSVTMHRDRYAVCCICLAWLLSHCTTSNIELRFQ